MKSGKFIETLAKSLASRLQKALSSSSSSDQQEEVLHEITAQEQKQFPFEILRAATRDFHPKLKLGEGGFGPVYKGKLEDGREIAVKKLCRGSKQGRREFANEARLLSRVQHKNVVNLLGYCAHGTEKLLVYEYVANESLDKLLFFDERKRGELDWKRRHELISGKRNATFKSEADAQNLLQWAWKLHKKGRALEIIDPILVPKEATDQILMCIQIGLLCTQGDPKLRPIMRRVVVMLSKKPGSLEEPARPGYPGARYMRSHRHSSGKQQHSASVSTSNLDTTITCTLPESPGPPSHQRHPSES
ncbi:hypothetical protein MRB53_017010 [Persea americana]|uniref:Uncharacterized protein n=1 Tax=Persea americana TaxID=3435 RepID=A0ACC2M3H6_PERAE|nr:hypothetical protein MRB53_017010 [Persea americana]